MKSTFGDILHNGFGVIIRTVAQNQDRKIIEDDMRNVLKKWERILNKLEESKPPALLYKDLDITESLIRDLFAKHYDRVLIDDYQLYKYIRRIVSQMTIKIMPATAH